jgi:ribosomal protein S18 acetylase RimI-like enzyme
MKYEGLKPIRVSRDNEAYFYDHIGNNFADYFFFHVDYVQYPESTEIYMVLDNENNVHAMVLIWQDRRIQLRGSNVGLELLLNEKNYNIISVTGFESHRKMISKYFPAYRKEIALYRMGLIKGEQKDFEKYDFQRLTESHKEEITLLMRISDPIFWGSREPDDILIDENNTWYGIIQRKELISIVSIWRYEKIGYVTVVGTHPDYRNQGHASSLISSVLKDLFLEKEQCFIMVRVANAPAIHAYKKLGFSILNTHYSYEKL